MGLADTAEVTRKTRDGAGRYCWSYT